MLVLIDESGDTGFKEGSSRYFVMTLIVFDDLKTGRSEKAEHTSKAIRSTKKKIEHKPEFHFSQCSHKARLAFLNGLNEHNCDFKIYSIVVDKKKIYSSHLKKHKKKFYSFILKQLLANNPIRNAIVKVDGDKSKAFKKELKTYLRKGNDGLISDLKYRKSENDFLIQLADMCCGAIAYDFNKNDRLESDLYRNLLRERVKNVWEFQ